MSSAGGTNPIHTPGDDPITAATLEESVIPFPESVFLFGADLGHASDRLREADERWRLGLGSVLAPTPPHWVHLPAFSMGRRMVTNGEYLRFLNHTDDAAGRVYDSPEIWDEVWSGRDLRIHRSFASIRSREGTVEVHEEAYGDAVGFVDAYIASIRYEIVRLLQRESVPRGTSPGKDVETRFHLMKRTDGDGTRRIPLRRGAVVHRLFALLKHLLRGAVLPPDGDESAILSRKEQEVLSAYDDRKKAIDDIDDLIEKLGDRYGEMAGSRHHASMAPGKHRVETILFLERCRRVIRQDPEATSIPLHRVLYPRGWPTPDGERKGTFVMRRGRRVAWEDRPVVGITLHEAAAYAVWLSALTGEDVSLPNEAEFERASSWPAAAGAVRGEEMILDPGEKDLIPWERERPDDIAAIPIGTDTEAGGLPTGDREAYARLLEETSRPAGDGRLYMLEGFGWHWTEDRLDEHEVRYGRFRDPACRRFRGVPCRLTSGEPVEVLEYAPNTRIDATRFTLRGSPATLGGPAITTRRYAAFPLRGYPDVGFRIVRRLPAEGGLP